MNEVSGPLEAILLMATEPVSSLELARVVGLPAEVVEDELENLARYYTETGRGFRLLKIAGGWRYYTAPEHHEVVSRWVIGDAQAKLSQAALETLAVIAYSQPVTRGRVSAIRGVNVDGVVRTLITRGLIEIVGSEPDTGASLLVTTSSFLEKMGLNSLDQLPPLAPHLPDAVQLEKELVELAERTEESRG